MVCDEARGEAEEKHEKPWENLVFILIVAKSQWKILICIQQVGWDGMWGEQVTAAGLGNKLEMGDKRCQ